MTRSRTVMSLRSAKNSFGAGWDEDRRRTVMIKPSIVRIEGDIHQHSGR
jgi:hypothetical protein